MPLERVSIGFRDISLSLRKNPLSRDVVILQNESAIARSVQNLVLTIKGEKFFEPTLGTSANALLFETVSLDTARTLQSEIERVIQNNEPRVQLIETTVTPNYDDGAMEVTIVFLIIGIDALPQQLQFILLPTR